MFTPAQLLAMTDNELGTHASGGYGAKLRNEFYASLRAGLEKADAKGQIVESLRAVVPFSEFANRMIDDAEQAKRAADNSSFFDDHHRDGRPFRPTEQDPLLA